MLIVSTTDKNKIMFVDRLSQPISFEGLNLSDKMFPTDIDAMIEYKNKAYIFIEVKYRDKEMSTGQRIAIERLVNDTGKNKWAIALLVNHSQNNTKQPVILRDCTVQALYYSKERKWRQPLINELKTDEAIFKFITQIKGRY